MAISYHNHTQWSDGTGTVRDMVLAAREAGLDELGLSDHLAILPGNSTVTWSLPLDRVSEYATCVAEEARGARSVTVRLGLEADYFPVTDASLREVLGRSPFDYVIGSVHIVRGIQLDDKIPAWDLQSPEERDRRWLDYWARVREVVASGLFDIVGHLDLPKRFGYRPTSVFWQEAHATLDAIAAAGMAIEVNASGWYTPAQECFPGPPLLKEACRRAIPIIISADAHRPDHVVRDLARAAAVAAEAGYTSVLVFENRTARTVGLEA
jgi:histidinol-phosphatase (PHP family)